ncbi:hypothetical protein GCM10022631_25960 [Deinococcus rubellus]|uniref:hypothetical protein n=1 Tax=Deinococcus rubellus TaxID=1889240 RepID=UPI0031E65CA7
MLYPAFTALLYLQELTRTLSTELLDSTNSAPRSFARWMLPEQQLLAALTVHGVSADAIARVVQRTWNAIERRNQDIEAGKTRAASINDLPLSPLKLSERDVELLIRWAEPPLRNPLGWQYGAPWVTDVLAPSTHPVLRIVEVHPDQSPLKTTGREPRDAAYEEMAARATWVDVATRLTHQSGQVLLPWPDDHQTQQLAIREALRRAKGKSPPKRTVLEFPFRDLRQQQQATVLIDRPEAWFLADIANVQAQVVVLVIPALLAPADPLPPPVPLNKRPVWPHLLTKAELPALLRAVSPAAAKVNWANREHLIERWSHKRRIEVIRQHGVPNTTHIPARLDWPALRILPPSGQVVAHRKELLVRAAVWYSLTQQRTAHLPEDLTQHLDTLLPRHASDHVSLICDALTGPGPTSVPTSEAVLARIWADIRHLSDPGPSDLQFAVGTHEIMDYIGH